MANCPLACWPGVVPESLTVTVKLNVPRAVGTPEMPPVEALRDKPDGSDPALTDQVSGLAPPSVESCAR